MQSLQVGEIVSAEQADWAARQGLFHAAKIPSMTTLLDSPITTVAGQDRFRRAVAGDADRMVNV